MSWGQGVPAPGCENFHSMGSRLQIFETPRPDGFVGAHSVTWIEVASNLLVARAVSRLCASYWRILRTFGTDIRIHDLRRGNRLARTTEVGFRDLWR